VADDEEREGVRPRRSKKITVAKQFSFMVRLELGQVQQA
jgi:hypothetical protein